MSVSVWEAIFMLVVLKLPVLYLAGVVWWAVRAQPEPPGEDAAGVVLPLTPCGWSDWKQRRPRSPRPRPLRPSGYRRAARVRVP